MGENILITSKLEKFFFCREKVDRYAVILPGKSCSFAALFAPRWWLISWLKEAVDDIGALHQFDKVIGTCVTQIQKNHTCCIVTGNLQDSLQNTVLEQRAGFFLTSVSLN